MGPTFKKKWNKFFSFSKQADLLQVHRSQNSGSKVRTEKLNSAEKPRQLFWEKRLAGLRPSYPVSKKKLSWNLKFFFEFKKQTRGNSVFSLELHWRSEYQILEYRKHYVIRTSWHMYRSLSTAHIQLHNCAPVKIRSPIV